MEQQTDSVYFIGCMRRQLSRAMSADASFLFDKAAVLRKTITETLCPSLLKVQVQRLSRLSEIYFCADKYNFSRLYKRALKKTRIRLVHFAI